MFLPSGVCWWLKKGWVPVDVFSTGWWQEGHLASLHQLPLMECISPSTSLLLPPSLLLLSEKDMDMVLNRIYREGTSRENQLTQVCQKDGHWTVMYVCVCVNWHLVCKSLHVSTTCEFLTCVSVSITEHVIDIGWMSVCLTVTRWYCVEAAQPIVKLSSLPGSPMILVFWGRHFFPEFQWEHPQWGVKCKGVGKSCSFRPISRYSS